MKPEELRLEGLIEDLKAQGPEKDTNIKEYVPETGFGVLEAVPGRRATFHDCFPLGLGRFFQRSGIQGKFLYVAFLCVSFWRL